LEDNEKLGSRRRIYVGIAIAAVAAAFTIGIVVLFTSSSSPLVPPTNSATNNNSNNLQTSSGVNQSKAGDIIPIFSQDSKPYGKSYEDWSVDWWKRLQSQPAMSNPVSDTTGERCNFGQTDPNVWFAYGTMGGAVERTCTISSSKALFIPILVSECSDREDASLNTDDKRRDCVLAGAKRGVLSVSVDGHEIPDLQKYWFESRLLNFILPEGNIWAVPPGNANEYVGGYYVMLQPLEPGNHVLHVRAANTSIEGTQLFAVDVVYKLTVVKSG
jgi:hypothetical protein